MLALDATTAERFAEDLMTAVDRHEDLPSVRQARARFRHACNAAEAHAGHLLSGRELIAVPPVAEAFVQLVHAVAEAEAKAASSERRRGMPG
jgi:hypothetical protein